MAKQSCRALNKTGKEPKRRGEQEEFTWDLREEEEAPDKEIDGEGRSSGSSFDAVALRTRVREGSGAGRGGAQGLLI
jgi:hypothetical protein